MSENNRDKVKSVAEMIVESEYPFGIYFKDHDFHGAGYATKEKTLQIGLVLAEARMEIFNNRFASFNELKNFYYKVLKKIENITEFYKEYEVSIWFSLILSLGLRTTNKFKKLKKVMKKVIEKYGKSILEEIPFKPGFNYSWLVNNINSKMQVMFDVCEKYRFEIKDKDFPIDIKTLLIFTLLHLNSSESASIEFYKNKKELLDTCCFKVQSSLKKSLVSSSENILNLRNVVSEIKHIPAIILHLILVVYTINEVTE